MRLWLSSVITSTSARQSGHQAKVALARRTTIRVSLRSVGDVDVSAIATHFGGGGHAFAAGFTAAAPLDRVLAEIREVLVAVRATAGERR